MNLNFRMKKRPVRQADLAELKKEIDAKGVPDPLALNVLEVDTIKEKTINNRLWLEKPTTDKYFFNNSDWHIRMNGTAGITIGPTALSSVADFYGPLDFPIMFHNNLKVNGSVSVSNDTVTAASGTVGRIRYVETASSSSVEMVMKTGAATYAWVVIKTNTW